MGRNCSIKYITYFTWCLLELINVSAMQLIDKKSVNKTIGVDCFSRLQEKGPKECHPHNCARIIMDNVFSIEDIDNLHSIALKGMSQRPALGGPTILDINTGYIRDSDGLENLFYKENDIYTTEDFMTYARIIQKLKGLVEVNFGISSLHFTAPTF
eukprot:gene8031-16458_t